MLRKNKQKKVFDMQGLMLAAGMGKRLGKYTNNNTKCMVEIAGKKLIDRAIEALQYAGINKMVMVVGYKGQNVIDYINENYKNSSMKFEFIFNHDYDKTNNIYSFYMAKDFIINEDTILMESDLIYDKALIKKIVEDKNPDIAVIAKYQSWMDGTVVTCNEDGFITQFVEKKDMDYSKLDTYYKTVNVYKLSKEFSKNVYVPFLEAYMKAYGMDSYYETTLKAVAHLSKTKLFGYEIGDMPWYEIDDAQDLDISNVLFSSGEQKYNLITSKFGGYWRYNSILDFCYLVNPYFPTVDLINKVKNELPVLVGSYPSGLNIQNMNAERMFGVEQDYILVGNGAAELINALGHVSAGKKVAVGVPTFNEYVRCFKNSEIVYVDNSKSNYTHNVEQYKKVCKEVDILSIVSPDNPSGDMLKYDQVCDILKCAKETNTTVIIDESFVDFADDKNYYTLLNNQILEDNPNLIVVKSIGKSYGVAGFRLGVLATTNLELLKTIREEMQVWNINSFAEYFLQIFNLYAKDYKKSCVYIAKERNRMLDSLNKIKDISVYPSQANFIMIALHEKSSRKFCIDALDDAGLLLKDLSTKNFFEGNFIRIAVKSEKENNQLLDYLKNQLG